MERMHKYKPRNGDKNNRLTVRLTDDEMDQLKIIALKNDVTLSDALRSAIPYLYKNEGFK